jgi:hypothetical protein
MECQGAIDAMCLATCTTMATSGAPSCSNVSAIRAVPLDVRAVRLETYRIFISTAIEHRIVDLLPTLERHPISASQRTGNDNESTGQAVAHAVALVR